MFKNRKIKKAIKEARKPEIPFAEFCRIHGIEIENKTAAKRGGLIKKIVIPISATAVAAVVIALPLALRTPSNNSGIVWYGEDDVASEQITDEQLQQDGQLFLFNTDNEFYRKSNMRIYPIENESLLIGYVIDEVILTWSDNDAQYAYEFKYLVRCYDGFMFAGSSNYDGLTGEYIVDGQKFDYVVRPVDGSMQSYIHFERGSYDYYIALQGFAQITEITDGSVETFLQVAFGQ